MHALAEFGARGYGGVSVIELAAGAGVTTGSLYHHFGSKLGLYTFVRDDVERRALDRMEGASGARSGDGLAVAISVGIARRVRLRGRRELRSPSRRAASRA